MVKEETKTRNELITELSAKYNISSENVAVKQSYRAKDGEIKIGCFSSKLDNTFYFYNEFNGKYYKIPIGTKSSCKKEDFQGKLKYQVPFEYCVELQEVKIPSIEEELRDMINWSSGVELHSHDARVGVSCLTTIMKAQLEILSRLNK